MKSQNVINFCSNTDEMTVIPVRKQEYERDGFVVEKGLFDTAAINAFISEATCVCREHAGRLTDWNDKPTPDGERFVNMAEDEILSRVLAIHFPHKLSDLFAGALRHPGIIARLQDIVGPNVKCAQSMLFIKHSGKPGQAWHQDENFIPTRDRSLVGVWVALDKATPENGCLAVLPGSHKPGVIYPTREHGSAEHDGAPESFDYPDDPAKAINVELNPGDVVFFNGYLLHKSGPNRAPAGQCRRALVHHYLSAESMLPWNMGGLIEPTQDNRDIVPVCGDDPYAWKGIEHNNKPFIRADTW